MDARELLIAWLNDAHAMEQALEQTLESHAKDADDDAEVRARIERHVEQTRQQALTLQGCIESLGGSVSGGKSALATMFGKMQGVMNRPAGDTMVKNALADYAAEHYEIACYRALIVACEQLGEHDIAARLKPILAEEEEMADFVHDRLPGAVKQALAAA